MNMSRLRRELGKAVGGRQAVCHAGSQHGGLSLDRRGGGLGPGRQGGETGGDGRVGRCGFLNKEPTVFRPARISLPAVEANPSTVSTTSVMVILLPPGQVEPSPRWRRERAVVLVNRESGLRLFAWRSER